MPRHERKYLLGLAPPQLPPQLARVGMKENNNNKRKNKKCREKCYKENTENTNHQKQSLVLAFQNVNWKTKEKTNRISVRKENVHTEENLIRNINILSQKKWVRTKWVKWVHYDYSKWLTKTISSFMYILYIKLKWLLTRNALK